MTSDSGEQACKFYVDKNPDVVVMDLSMPGIGGLEAIRRIVARDADAKVLVYLSYYSCHFCLSTD